jgi:hypothetical protein
MSKKCVVQLGHLICWSWFDIDKYRSGSGSGSGISDSATPIRCPARIDAGDGVYQMWKVLTV